MQSGIQRKIQLEGSRSVLERTTGQKRMLKTDTVKDGFQSSSGTLQALAGSLSHGIFRAFGTHELTRTSQLNFFPLTTIHTETGSPFWYQVVCSPDSAKQTTLRCDIYLPKTIDSFQFEGKIKDALESHIRSNIQDYEKAYARIIDLNNAPTSSYGRFSSIYSQFHRHYC